MFENFQQVKLFFESRKFLGIQPGLDRMEYLLHSLGNPQQSTPALHIAGTNGKGSTIEFIKKALQINGYRVGVFTSPSLDGLTGHIFKDNTSISEESFVDILNEIHSIILHLDREGMSPTEFEIITAMAFMYFTKHVDIILIEAGMGGREDTTNCISPIMSIITNVEKDHTSFLGDTLREIAYHKAGIIKQDTPAIVGDMANEAREVVIQEAREKQVSLHQMGQDFIYEVKASADNLQRFVWKNSRDTKIDIAIRMYGEHQVKNASMAYMSLVKLKEIGYTIDMERCIEAFKNIQVPGRFEIIQHEPLVILDGAHNPAGIQSFIETVLTNYSNKERHLLFAAFKDKDTAAMLEQLSKHFSSIALTTFNHPRAASAEELYNMTASGNKSCLHDWKEVLPLTHKKDAIYFITGSLHFIAFVRTYFINKE
ncbi:folylpolyglutamate synthase/dihydrofolate synthase family protein [Virgibacillus sp. C22-A2]|uniref:tetrahydrofolate synthase n=1 Tax=Virgibacillus tibetensis TaxID=3042313 RepID=A0ABU6K9M5_9BACI|nr:folylpolyglutamate synthase/dihydrofolate synthase family protein [Virgibacillus sp. C22-A2]